MKIPKLNPSSRSREFNQYSNSEKSLICKAWLFQGIQHRELDRTILNLDPSVTKGFQSSGVLHYLGLDKEFKGIFNGSDLVEVLNLLEDDPQDFTTCIALLDYKLSFHAFTECNFRRIEDSLKDTSEERQKRLRGVRNKSIRRRVFVEAYSRNPDVVAEALYRSNGICEKCGNGAPFIRRRNKTPYLEVHHLRPLSEQSYTNENLDVLSNVIALCPNCHREIHFG